MIHKFVANDNKGNVNILEVTSTGTKLGKVEAPVEDTDAATKKYVDDNTVNNIVLNATWGETYPFINITTSPLPSMADVQKCFETGGKVFLHIGATTIVSLSGVEKTITQFDYYYFTGRGVDYDGNVQIFYVLLYDDDGVTGYSAYAIDDRKFIVTLTPTSPDYSGTMDKTVAEINAAYEAGQQIVFRVVIDANQYMDVNCTATFSNGSEYPSFNAYIIGGDTDTALYAYTGATTTGTDNTYATKVYPLTPAS